MVSGGLADIKTDAGFTDTNFNFGCQVKGDKNFGSIAISEVHSLKEIGQITVNASGVKTLFVNLYLYLGEGIYINQVYTNPQVIIKTGGGKVVASVSGSGNKVMSFKAVVGDTYFIYALIPTSAKIIGIGFGGQCYQGKRGWANAVLTIYDEYYDKTNSTLLNSVGVTVYFQGLPTILSGNVASMEALYPTDAGKEITISAELPYNSDGINYICDQQLNAKIKLIQNDFYGKNDIFNEVKLYFHVGGNDYFGIDLLSTQVTSKDTLVGQAVLPSGSYKDASYVLKVNLKKAEDISRYMVIAGLHLWYESGFPNLCS